MMPLRSFGNSACNWINLSGKRGQVSGSYPSINRGKPDSSGQLCDAGEFELRVEKIAFSRPIEPRGRFIHVVSFRNFRIGCEFKCRGPHSGHVTPQKPATREI
jgi:hypothetical protein